MIKNIIFDFGGVIYDIDHDLSKKAFLELGVESFDQLYGHYIQTSIFEQIEKGLISEAEFRSAIRKFLPRNPSDEQIDHAWCALMIGFDPKKIDLLEKLGDHYRLFLLSNSNIIHYKRFIKELNYYRDFRGLFDDVWFSHEKGQRKPDAQIYLDLMEENNLKPSESLFIDDLWINIDAAQKLGIQTHFLGKGQNILDLFDDATWKIS